MAAETVAVIAGVIVADVVEAVAGVVADAGAMAGAVTAADMAAMEEDGTRILVTKEGSGATTQVVAFCFSMHPTRWESFVESTA